MTTEKLNYFGVSTPALLPDEPAPETAFSAVRGAAAPSSDHDLLQHSDELEAVLRRPLGTKVAGSAYSPVLGRCETAKNPAAAEKDWRCEKHGTTGWRGDHCRVCAAEIPKVNKYTSLENVLRRALSQAAVGKGAERHANGLAFEDQPMQTVSRLVGTHGGLLYQAIKKTQESTRMETGAAVRELLGAINYLAGAIIYLESPK